MSTKLYDISNWCRQGSEVEDYPYIGEINIDLSMGTVVNVNGNYYIPGVRNLNKNSAGVRKVEINLEPEDKDYTDNLTCPYCGYEDSNSWELGDSDDEHQCGQCCATISYERVVTVEYNSSAKVPPEIVKAKWK